VWIADGEWEKGAKNRADDLFFFQTILFERGVMVGISNFAARGSDGNRKRGWVKSVYTEWFFWHILHLGKKALSQDE